MTIKTKLLLMLLGLALLSGCSSLKPAHMVPFEQMGVPNESAIKSLSVSQVSAVHDSRLMMIKPDNSEEVKKALASTLRSYRLLNSESNKSISVDINITNSSDWGDFTAACEATYSIYENNLPVKDVVIKTTYTAELDHAQMWKGALVAGVTVGVAANVKMNTGSTTKAILGGAAAGVITSKVINQNPSELAGPEDMPEPGLYLTDSELKQLDAIAYAREGTPLNDTDGTKRMKIAMESSIRKNFALFIRKVLDGEIAL